jgi:hypothetical protein
MSQYDPYRQPPQNYQPQYPHPGQYPPPGYEVRKRRSWPRRHWFLTFFTFPFLGLVLIIVIAVAASSGGTGTAGGTSVAGASNASPAAAPSAAASSPMTVGEQQAIEGAQGYLSMGSGFSYNSLLDQLTSSDGDGDTTADAEFAIKFLNPDWDAQAVDAAKGYLQIGGFSRASLIDQLTSSDGDGFTESQAEYAVDKVGL